MLAFVPPLAFAAIIAAQAVPLINTPTSVAQCRPVQITWTATNTPVFISILPGGQTGAPPLMDFGEQTGSSITWIANILAGTSITFQIRDSQGAIAFSSPVTVQSSPDPSCIFADASTATVPAATSTAFSTSEASSLAVSAATSIAPTISSPTTSQVANTSPSAGDVASQAPSPFETSGSLPMSNARAGLAGPLGLAAAMVVAQISFVGL